MQDLHGARVVEGAFRVPIDRTMLHIVATRGGAI